VRTHGVIADVCKLQLPAWNWLPPESASPRLNLVPLSVRVWYQLDVAAWVLGDPATRDGAGAQ
jgi:hypothetical protein